MSRPDKRKNDSLRKVNLQPGFLKYAEGSCLIEIGETRVICSASIEDQVPYFLRDQGRGWITAEYSMLPRSCRTRTVRESSKGKVGGRTHEIQRLIGRSLRAVVDMKALGERTVWIDCDVIQADGGTRTAGITGSYVALAQALKRLRNQGKLNSFPLRDFIAAISVGIVDGIPLLDLNYDEDCKADVDMNVVMTGQGKFVELQGTAEQEPFDRDQLRLMMEMAEGGIKKLIRSQELALKNMELNS